jgi:hypothetical protein
MNYRINTKVIFAVSALVIAFVAFFVYMLVSAPVDVKNNVAENDNATTSAEDTVDFILTAKHQYLDGIHTIVGKTELPTLCHRLVSEPFFVSDNNVEIRFSTIMVGEECENKLSEEKFKVSFEAPEDVDITATWNGKKVRLNLIPLQEGETLDDEIYIKG